MGRNWKEEIHIPNGYEKGLRVLYSDLDGCTFVTDNAWGIVCASPTQGRIVFKTLLATGTDHGVYSHEND